MRGTQPKRKQQQQQQQKIENETRKKDSKAHKYKFFFQKGDASYFFLSGNREVRGDTRDNK